ncbi:hypothetical protein IFM89_033006 [Coptis chinensis]|uniref:Uncharacterized protein n=1 Tax=Coptis chinensis TaxID=261450 RepID=A0A835IFN7_9MAGN|nr:hypothetical protein IFM89_033006 [Coptis chinensis]
MSVGISKTALASSAPAKERLCQQKQQHSMLRAVLKFGATNGHPHQDLARDKRRSGGQQSHRRIVLDSSATSNVRDPTRSQSHGDSSRGWNYVN